MKQIGQLREKPSVFVSPHYYSGCQHLEAARKLLGISPKTWQNYRDQRIIPFSQIGRKIYVNRTDLDAFLRRHRIR